MIVGVYVMTIVLIVCATLAVALIVIHQFIQKRPAIGETLELERMFSLPSYEPLR